ncbi:MAG TPA: dienelactone hydrolase family protein [Lacunisphaera sp.]|nr:dienelactone hydrolase family protein [Lacunisphaera sp.]
MTSIAHPSITRTEISIGAGVTRLHGLLEVPANAVGLVLFVHGSGSNRHSPRNQHVAEILHLRGLATLLFDLLTGPEQRQDAQSAHLRFDIPFLVQRLQRTKAWVMADPHIGGLPLGYFGASTGAAAALVGAAADPEHVRAVVSRGGRPDLAMSSLPSVTAPTLLIVGSDDTEVLAMNRHAFGQLGGRRRLEVVPGAGHLFEEPGTLETVAELAGDWFAAHLSR